MATAARRNLGEKAKHLRALHVPHMPLLVPNVWDVASAGQVALRDFPVLATTSAGVAETHGYPDHEGMPAEVAFAAIYEISSRSDLPVTADIEAGYGLDPAELASRLIDAGACGCNLEDTNHQDGGRRYALAEQAGRIRHLIAEARSLGVDLVVNARIDTWLRSDVGSQDALEDAITRARAYSEAGAACVFPILVRDVSVVRHLAETLQSPVNFMPWPGGPSTDELARLGAARISIGPRLFRRAVAHIGAMLDGGAYLV